MSERTEEQQILDVPADVDEQSVSAGTGVDVGKALRQGGLWTVIAYTFSRVSGFAASIVLARLLVPEDYGLIAMVNTVLALVQILGVLGIGAAIINQKHNVEGYANTGWWLDIFCGLALFAIANLASPAAAIYYKTDSIRILIAVASVNFLINPFGNTMDALLSKNLKFRTTTSISLISGTIATVLTIILAFSGAGVWSFVVPHIFAGIAAVIMRWRACAFRPHRSVDWSLAKPIWLFGRNILGSNIFDYINRNIDYILVGGLMGDRQLGLYLFAYQLGTWIVANVASTLVSLLFPTISFVQEDRPRARAIFLRMMRVIAAVGLPIVVIQWVTAPLFIGAVYGDKWLPAVTAFRLIALYGIGRAICAPTMTLMSAMGRPDVCFKMNAAASPVLVLAVFIGSQHGINGVALATAIVHGVLVWLYLLIPFRLLKWDLRDAWEAIVPSLTSALIAGVLCAAVQRSGLLPGGKLAVLLQLVLVGFAAYLVAAYLLYREVVKELFRVVRLTVQEAKSR